MPGASIEYYVAAVIWSNRQHFLSEKQETQKILQEPEVSFKEMLKASNLECSCVCNMGSVHIVETKPLSRANLFYTCVHLE